MSARNIGPYTLNRYYRYIGWINCMDTMTQLVCIMFEIAASDHSWIYCWYFFFIIVRESNLYYISSRGRNITQRYNMSCDSVNSPAETFSYIRYSVPVELSCMHPTMLWSLAQLYRITNKHKDGQIALFRIM